MRSLRVKIALILIGSIAAVMLVATVVTIMMLSAGDSARMIGPMVDHIEFSQRQLSDPNGITQRPPRDGDKAPRPPRDRIADAPAAGQAMPELAAELKQALVRQGMNGTVLVTQDARTGQPVASYDLGGGKWGQYAFPRPLSPPPQFWLVLGSWLLLMLIGVTGVALFMARRVTQPFVILERAVSSVGPDGILPHLPETGSGEVRHTASVLNRLSDRLRTSMESRMRLVAAAGHDLRTPMTRMRLRAEFLPDDERASWLVDLDELDQIADSAIRLVREEGAGEDQVDIDLEALVSETTNDLARSNIAVTLGEHSAATVKAGLMSLRRALRNLMINAATHGGGGQVMLETLGNSALITIEDDGPGIPEDMMAHVFEPFFRAEPGRTRRIKGAGLGLAIAKDIVERFGGAIEIENRPEGGLRQTITLPLVHS